MLTAQGAKPRKLAPLIVMSIVMSFVLAAVAVLAILFLTPLRSLATLRQVDDYPLYVMHLYGSYGFDEYLEEGLQANSELPSPKHQPSDPWACSVFATLNQDSDLLLGRNFDWFNRPTLLLFTHPPDGYTSVSMVDMSYLGLGTGEPSWSDRIRLLDAPYLPFDGMNEHGLAVGMMAVPQAQGAQDPQQATIDSLEAIRLVLDDARSVEEAVALLGSYNIDWGSGPALHYLVADAGGQSAVIEFVAGEMVVLPNEEAWQVATNFTMSGHTPKGAKRLCQRYAQAYERLESMGGQLSDAQAMGLLQDVSQNITMWSILYNLTTGDISAVMGRDYDQVHEFQLGMGSR